MYSEYQHYRLLRIHTFVFNTTSSLRSFDCATFGCSAQDDRTPASLREILRLRFALRLRSAQDDKSPAALREILRLRFALRLRSLRMTEILPRFSINSFTLSPSDKNKLQKSYKKVTKSVDFVTFCAIIYT